MSQQIMLRQRGQTADPDVFGSLRYLDDTRVSIDPHLGPERLRCISQSLAMSCRGLTVAAVTGLRQV